MKYEKFEEWMIGKKFYNMCDHNDLGVIVDNKDDETVNVIYENDGPSWARLYNVVFVDSPEEKPSDNKATISEGSQIDWQVGQVVWDVVYGKGVVDEVSGGYARPIEVQFIDGVRTYTVDGKPDKELARTLFFSEPVITAELYPPKKPFNPVLEKGDTVVVKWADTTQVLVVSEETERQLKGSRGEVWDKDHDVHFYKIGEEVKFK